MLTILQDANICGTPFSSNAVMLALLSVANVNRRHSFYVKLLSILVMSLETGIAFEFFKYIPGSFTHHMLSGMYFHEQKANISTDEISKAEQLAASQHCCYDILVSRA